ncbi:phosphate ABC transporter substrate-binding protein PstS family protein [Lacticaseibacillus pabuli]|uniref:Phosphate-binding protein n=1 Tax=Lacticaseibacillus pabuli TaxID=3025672 RepID=A0ABY7WP59_9LACO|nr:phosphate ABC transporter substrate-binding protein PstS family protein [Lacticaseibacillus sp. KACC 23028]WDF81987.1 phosphate ABC transporter substrate-binding protein PstS family protein [Lacticaseibacillus sp. KACC 23028]
MRLKNMLLSAIGLVAVSIGLSGCKTNNGESITVVGSSALQPLVEAAGEQYSSDHLGVFINVQGGGSGTGLSQIQSKAVAIGNSDLFADEKPDIKADQLVDHKVAVVGVAPIINKKVGIKNLTATQLRNIFTGRVTNWREVGGKNMPVVIINRTQGSGTRATFERWVLKDQPAIAAQEQDSSGMVRSIVATTPGAISYVAFSYVDKTVQPVSINGVAPTDQNVHANHWQIWSYEHMYTNGPAKGLTKDLIAYILSHKIQSTLVKQMGYIPMNDMQVERDSKGRVIK